MAQTHAALATTIIFSSPSVQVTDGQLVTVPPNGWNVPQNTYRSLRILINLSDADKLAVGKTLLLNSFLSFDNGTTWDFINGINWTSYGPGGYTVTDPDGTVHVNPDPTLFVPLNNINAQTKGRLQYQAQGISTAGVTILGNNL